MAVFLDGCFVDLVTRSVAWLAEGDSIAHFKNTDKRYGVVDDLSQHESFNSLGNQPKNEWAVNTLNAPLAGMFLSASMKKTHTGY
jgi:hypothetical protein